jgi:DNA (cytosine-5)-methyltransferase 1
MERTAFEENEKHVLYREYLRILALYKPAVFVMENVKGLLSATYAGNSTFERIISDLSSPTAAMRESMKRRTPQTRRGSDYTVLPLVQPSTTKPRPEDYLIAAENFGVPQAASGHSVRGSFRPGRTKRREPAAERGACGPGRAC